MLSRVGSLKVVAALMENGIAVIEQTLRINERLALGVAILSTASFGGCCSSVTVSDRQGGAEVWIALRVAWPVFWDALCPTCEVSAAPGHLIGGRAFWNTHLRAGD